MAGERILIVEDNEKNLKLVRDVLQHHGYQTVEARTAEDGIELAAADPPDLVLMDIELPGIGGLEAIGQLKSDQRTAAIPVCALTASAMEGDRERCLRAGFDDYLTKPISVSEFPEQVRGWLGGARGVSSA